MDPARAFALASILFYVLFVAAAFALAERALKSPGSGPRGRPPVPRLRPALRDPRHSLSNDGNYVEVLALGTLALLVLAAWLDDEERPPPVLPWVAGLLIGLAFWCHILAVIHGACAMVLLPVGRGHRQGRGGARRGRPPRAWPWGFALGYAPGLLWNAAHGWASFQYLLPGQAVAGAGGRHRLPRRRARRSRGRARRLRPRLPRRPPTPRSAGRRSRPSPPRPGP